MTKSIFMKITNALLFYFFITALIGCSSNIPQARSTENFCDNWKFHLGDIEKGNEIDLNDSSWRKLDLPHDWSIEGEFNKDNPAGVGGGALPGNRLVQKNFHTP